MGLYVHIDGHVRITNTYPVGHRMGLKLWP